MNEQSSPAQRSEKKPYVRPAFKVIRHLEPASTPARTGWGRFRKAMRTFHEKVRGHQSEARKVELAYEIVEFGRMRSVRGEAVIIEVPEVAYRLRESTRHVRQSLLLLEAKGIAAKTQSADHWKLVA